MLRVTNASELAGQRCFKSLKIKTTKTQYEFIRDLRQYCESISQSLGIDRILIVGFSNDQELVYSDKNDIRHHVIISFKSDISHHDVTLFCHESLHREFILFKLAE